ncbi:MAG: hypothetical protein QM724_02245 [Flavobacteriales bacterium]
MPRKEKDSKKVLRGLEKTVKRAEQKAQGALDGRFRERKVESKKRYARKPKHKGQDDEAAK